MNLTTIGKLVERFARDNSPLILTTVAIAGTVSTAILSGKAALRANQILKEEQERLGMREIFPTFDAREKARLVWRCYIPPAGMGVLTIGAILGVNRIGTRRTAAIAAAYSILENSFDEYREKVVEKLGERKEGALRDELAQEQIKRNPVGDREVIVCLNGDVLCYDAYTGRYFTSSVEELRKAANEINFQIIHHNYASLADFYILVGLPPTMMSESVGWNVDRKLELQLTTCMSEDERPCVHVAFQVDPNPAYQRFL